MKKIIFAIFILFSCSYANASEYNVYGCVHDLESSPIGYASIAVLNATDSLFVSGTATIDNGEFSLQLPKGNYILKFYALGYNSAYYNLKLSNNVVISPILLQPEAFALNEVMVSGMRPTIKRNATGMIVSVDGVKHLQNKTLDRILNFSPGVYVDKKGNISINGNGSVTVIINDKTIHLSGEQLASYLKSIQGSELKDIEIINNPTSSYSAEGTGGIIRINTRRKAEIGLTGFASANYSYDRRSSYSPSLGLAYSFGRFTIYGNYSYSDNRSVSELFLDDIYKYSERQNIIEESIKGYNQNHNYRFGFDWNISSNHFFGLEYNGQSNRDRNDGKSTSQVIINSILSQSINAISSEQDRPYNNMLNLNYVWKIDTLGQSLKFIADYSDIIGTRSIGNYFNEYLDNNGIIVENMNKRQLSNESSKLYSLQLDYEKPFRTTGWKIRGGLKYSHIATNYNYNLLKWIDGNKPQDDPKFKDSFRFIEGLTAAYLNISYANEKFDANIGIRGEYTDRTGISYIKDERNSNTDFRLFPSCFTNYKLSGASAFMVYYGMRIQRPSYALLNPFVIYSTDLSYKIGNPELKPMISNVVELTYVLNNTYYLSMRVNMTNDKIRDYSFVDGEYTVTTFANISQSNMYYLNAYIPFTLKKWTSSILLNIGLLDTKAKERSKKALTMDFSWDNYVQLNDKLGLQGNLTYSPPYKDVYQTFKRHIVKLDISFDYSFMKDKWILSVGMDDILDSMHKRTITFNYPELTEHSTSYGMFSGRTTWVTLKFNFNTSKQVRERRKDKSNKDEINRL